MKNWFLLVCLAGILLAPLAAQEGPAVLIINNTGYTGYYLYMTPVDIDDWEEDLLGDDILPEGESLVIELSRPLSEANRYDIQLEDEDGDTYSKWDVLILPKTQIEFTQDDLD
ncbi:MAG: hypothetical protein LBP43_01400 [Treponema sp.]|jgi:hypothetical protein|nr:hypothetical protein [Treponema sp.]